MTPLFLDKYDPKHPITKQECLAKMFATMLLFLCSAAAPADSQPSCSMEMRSLLDDTEALTPLKPSPQPVSWETTLLATSVKLLMTPKMFHKLLRTRLRRCSYERVPGLFKENMCLRYEIF